MKFWSCVPVALRKGRTCNSSLSFGCMERRSFFWGAVHLQRNVSKAIAITNMTARDSLQSGPWDLMMLHVIVACLWGFASQNMVPGWSKPYRFDTCARSVRWALRKFTTQNRHHLQIVCPLCNLTKLGWLNVTWGTYNVYAHNMSMLVPPALCRGLFFLTTFDLHAIYSQWFEDFEEDSKASNPRNFWSAIFQDQKYIPTNNRLSEQIFDYAILYSRFRF